VNPRGDAVKVRALWAMFSNDARRRVAVWYLFVLTLLPPSIGLLFVGDAAFGVFGLVVFAALVLWSNRALVRTNQSLLDEPEHRTDAL
jgi:hypothetical protein